MLGRKTIPVDIQITKAAMVAAESPITLDFCIWLHRNADRIMAGLQDAPAAIPAPPIAAEVVAGKRTCSLCDFPVHGHGLCRTHYGRMKRAQKVVGA
jgi:hypothetical protein